MEGGNKGWRRARANQEPPLHHEGWMDGWMDGWWVDSKLFSVESHSV